MKTLLTALSILAVAASCNMKDGKDAKKDLQQEQTEANKEFNEEVKDASKERNEELKEAKDEFKEEQKEEAEDYIEGADSATIDEERDQIDVEQPTEEDNR